jgi:calmodulin-binding transcription activator
VIEVATHNILHFVLCLTFYVYMLIAYQGSISVPARNDSSTSTQNGSSSRAEVHSSTGWTSELTAPGSNSYSLGSGGEVSSRTVTVNTETNNTSPSDRIQEKAALRKLEMQLSLEDKEEYDVNTEEVPSNNEPVIVHESQNEELEDCTDLNDIFNVLDFAEEHINEGGTRPPLSAIDVLQNSGAVFCILATIMHSRSFVGNRWL